MSRNRKEYVSLYLKGMMMGAADTVPGVSGGTVAFISGIYQELILSLSRLGPNALVVLFRSGFAAFWAHINGSFLATLVVGMLSSIVLLSSTVLYLLENYPQLIWGFFFGLICASSFVLSKNISRWNISAILSFVVAVFLSYLITTLNTSVLEPSLLNVFFAGMIAICAMILPGISGSFILLLLGMYSYVLMSIKTFDLMVLSVFALGCVAGLLSFSKLLHFFFDHFKNTTMALLTGFLLGSLNKVWPWKETLTTRINRHGLEVADSQQNISPFVFQEITGDSSFLISSCCLALFGALLVLGLEKLNKQ